jgi:quercetin dioxygenase-like cupin family protein
LINNPEDESVNHTIKKMAGKNMTGLFILSVFFAADCSVATETGAPLEPYNHILKRSTLIDGHGEEIQIREILFAPGWKAPRHYHNSDLFIYVISGEFEVDMEGEGLKTYTDGQALRMKPNTPMDARNPSDTKHLKLAVFQVGNPDAPFVVPVEREE